MPTSPRQIVLCRYHYDPLDRLANCTPLEEAGIQLYYCKTRLATEIQGAVHSSVFQHDDQLLAQQKRHGKKVDTALLATDQQRSVLNALDASQPNPLAYTAYGHRPPENGLLSFLGFNGERLDSVTGHYLLGNGYRAFNPVLMRFNNPDSWSPFGEGGVNAYAYCGGDPRNRIDPEGHNFFTVSKAVDRFLNLIGRSRTTAASTNRTGRTLTSSTTNAILENTPSRSSANIAAVSARPTYRNPMANAAQTSYLKRPEFTIARQSKLPSYDEAIMTPPAYSLPNSISDFERVWSREMPPIYYRITPRPPPPYSTIQQTPVQTRRITRPIGPPPPVPDRPPETLLPRTSNARVRRNSE